MAAFKTRLNGRKKRDLKLTAEEAAAMREEGIRFAEYAPEHDCCRLSSPYRLVIVPARGEVTIEQP